MEALYHIVVQSSATVLLEYFATNYMYITVINISLLQQPYNRVIHL